MDKSEESPHKTLHDLTEDEINAILFISHYCVYSHNKPKLENPHKKNETSHCDAACYYYFGK